MADAGYTHSQLAVMLVDGALSYIAGNLQGEMPFEPTLVTELQRAQVGLPPKGQTFFYPLRGSGVFIDMSGAVATIWFMAGDYDRALAALDSVLKKKFRAKQLSDQAQPVPKQRRRDYEVELGVKRLAHVAAEYAEPGAQNERFLVRVSAQVRK